MYASVYFLALEVQSGFHWCLVLGICFGSSQMNLIILYVGCTENKAQTEVVNFTKRVGTLHKIRFYRIFSFCCKHFWMW
jgi:hypothetical protein